MTIMQEVPPQLEVRDFCINAH